MPDRRRLTVIDIIVIILIVLMVLAILFPTLSYLQRVPLRVVCRTNLHGLGTALTVYANDYGDAFALQGADAKPVWATATDGWADPNNDWATAKRITVGASLYLLVRETDVSPKSFVCPGSAESVYEGQNPNSLDITELWDFGQWTVDPVKTRDDGIGSTHGPKNHVSYAYHMPYGPNGGPSEFAAGGKRPADFAVMGDKNPWFDAKLKSGAATAAKWKDCIGPMQAYKSGSDAWEVRRANTESHGREFQNVLYADGHTTLAKTADVGINRDNIYTRQAEGGSEEAIRIGDPKEMPTYTIDNKFQPRNETDSFLVNDDSRLAPYAAR